MKRRQHGAYVSPAKVPAVAKGTKKKRGPSHRPQKKRRNNVDTHVLMTVKSAKLGRDAVRIMLPRWR